MYVDGYQKLYLKHKKYTIDWDEKYEEYLLMKSNPNTIFSILDYFSFHLVNEKDFIKHCLEIR